MKKLFSNLAICALAVISAAAYAQSEQSTIKIRIEKNVDGKVQIIEKEIDASDMDESERDAMIEKLQDSLMSNHTAGAQKKMKVIIEDKRTDEVISDQEEDFDIRIEGEHPRPRVYTYKKRKGGDADWDEFKWEMDRFGEHFGDQMRRLGDEIPRKIERNMPRVYAWTDDMFTEMGMGAIRSLDVFPNKPDSEVINVRFFAPEEGDVNITVLDTKGKVVAQKEAKAFKGEFVGQLQLKKPEKGAYFVIVSQGNDGVSRRVMID